MSAAASPTKAAVSWPICQNMCSKPPGEITSFELSVKAKKDEVVFFSYIVFKSRAHRDKVNKQVMADPRLAAMDPKSMPFDSKRMIFGGFKPVVTF